MLILGAGVGVGPFGTTHDGLSSHYQVNNLSHYLFTLRLLPLLESTAKKPETTPGSVRIVSVSSELHRTAPSDVRFESKEEIMTDVGPNKLYARSKLGVILFTRALIRHKLTNIGSERPIFAIAVHPGAVGTYL
jgi:NAD(P)-dependent dehydrogenase (short-subunit alcohol dehydrogenase family)